MQSVGDRRIEIVRAFRQELDKRAAVSPNLFGRLREFRLQSARLVRSDARVIDLAVSMIEGNGSVDVVP